MLELPDGLYPFIDERFTLSELVMVEAPSDLEALFKSQAAANAVQIVRGEPIELRCQSVQAHPDHIAERAGCCEKKAPARDRSSRTAYADAASTLHAGFAGASHP